MLDKPKVICYNRENNERTNKVKRDMNVSWMIRNSKRKSHSSVVDLCKEFADNSRDAEATRIDFEFGNYKDQSYINDSGGMIKVWDNGRGFPLNNASGEYDFKKVMSLYGKQQSVTDDNQKSSENGIGMKDALDIMGNKWVVCTKAKDKEPRYVYKNIYDTDLDEYLNIDLLSYKDVLASETIPQHLRDEVRKAYEEYAWVEDASSGTGFVICETNKCCVRDSKSKNNFWETTKEPKKIHDLVECLSRGRREVLPLCMYYPKGVRGYDNPDIHINGKKLFSVTNPECVYIREDGSLGEVGYDHPDFDQGGFFSDNTESILVRSSLKVRGTTEYKYLLESGGKILYRGGTIVQFETRDKYAGWFMDYNRSRGAYVKETYLNTQEFQEFYKLDANKRLCSSNLFKQNANKELLDEVQQGLKKYVDSHYKDDEQGAEDCDPAENERLREDLEGMLGHFHKNNFVSRKNPSNDDDDGNAGTGGGGCGRGSGGSGARLRGLKITHDFDDNPTWPDGFERSKNGNGVEIKIYRNHPKVKRLFRLGQQRFYVMDVYARNMTKGDSLRRYFDLRDKLEDSIGD